MRCVEVTLDGWDTHANNHSLIRDLNAILDPALSALIRDLRRRGRLDKTVVICAGEFGRTPQMNTAGGRDHWPTGFSVALAGGGIRGGKIIGATDPDGKEQASRPGERRRPARHGADGGRHRPAQVEPDADRADGALQRREGGGGVGGEALTGIPTHLAPLPTPQTNRVFVGPMVSRNRRD